MTADLWRLDATAQADLVRRGEVSPGELLDAALARIDALNPHLNAVIARLDDLARAQAAERTGGPFDGVPLLLKDAGVEVAGTTCFLGTRLLRDLGYRSPRTDEMGRRLRRAGFVFAGKTNVPPLSNGATTEPPAFGPTRNPWAVDRTAGGSSGGAAAAVAAGMVSMAHGADATGSLRFPASACGVATLNPSTGLIPCTTPAGQPDPVGAWRTFVLTRTVRDLAGAFDALTAPGAVPAPPDPLPRLRVGLLPDFPGSRAPAEADCARAVEAAGATLESLGHHVEIAHPAGLATLFRDIGPAFAAIVGHARAAQLAWLEGVAGRAVTDEETQAGLVAQAAAGRGVTPAQLAAASAAVRAALAPIVAWWDDHDVLVGPVMRRVPWPLGEDAGAAHVGGFVQAWSLSGQPALSLPLHWTAGDLPVGVQLVGAPRADRLLLALAAEVEQAAPWAHRWPVVAGA